MLAGWDAGRNVLNPLGVPSRMNVGQILEITWVGRQGIGDQGGGRCSMERQKQRLRNAQKANLPTSGPNHADGPPNRGNVRSPVTVAHVCLKAPHLVDDKIHARSIGPYSLVTSSRSVARPNSAASGWEKWKCGRCRLWCCVHAARVLDGKSDDVPGRSVCTKRSSRVSRSWSPDCPSRLTSWSKSCRVWDSTSNWSSRKTNPFVCRP